MLFIGNGTAKDFATLFSNLALSNPDMATPIRYAAHTIESNPLLQMLSALEGLKKRAEKAQGVGQKKA